MALHPGDGSPEKALHKPDDSFRHSNSGNSLTCPSGVGESPKPTLAAAKAGVSFVIPKNKLSGALVPVVRTSAAKWELNEVKREDDLKFLVHQRKTRWGVDLTQDPAVKRGRALALQVTGLSDMAGVLFLVTMLSRLGPSRSLHSWSLGRRREQLELERREAIGDCLQLNPFYKPPSGYKPVYKEAKLYIPVKDYPGYNFIGLILGPRGNTQKRLEAETGSRIAIRGRGAVKEGKKSNAARLQGGRRDCKEAEGAFEDLHVHITADSVEKVDAAVALVEPLLTPVDVRPVDVRLPPVREDRNTHKRKQLRELAEMNGTMRDFSKACRTCGETGHREWHCAKDKLVTFHAKVDCQICGNGGHPTIDCLKKQAGQVKVLDKEYLSFLEELGHGLGVVSTTGLSTKSIGEDTSGKSSQSGLTPTVPPLGIAPISTSLDPNQLVDVISTPHPSMMGLSQPQHTPPSWPQGDAFTNNFEGRANLPQGGEADGPFPGVFQRHPAQYGFSVPSSSFPHPGMSHSSVPSSYQGCASASMSVNFGGLPATQYFHTRPDGVPTNRIQILPDNGAGSGSGSGSGSVNCAHTPSIGLVSMPGQFQSFKSAHREASTVLGSHWKQAQISPPVNAANAPVVWDIHHLPRPQIAPWIRGVPPQAALAPWQMSHEQGWKEKSPTVPQPFLNQPNCVQGWNEKCPAIPPSIFNQSTSAPWEGARKPWESTTTWSGPPLLTKLHPPWQPHFVSCPPQADGPEPSRRSFVWRGGPAPHTVPMPLPIQYENFITQGLPSQSNPSHSDPVPTSSTLPQPIADSTSFSTYPQLGALCTSLVPPPLPTAVRNQQQDKCSPHPPPKPSNTLSVDCQPTLKVAYAMAPQLHDSSTPSKRLSTLGTESLTKIFTDLPKVGMSQPNAELKVLSSRRSSSPCHESKAASNATAPSNGGDVDAEYEKLMASVGVI
ncbi:hypothetical protein AXG93_4368s2180 [Marchantia polymorpha subsp. ruderalis]|uniref:K Homology domain-containing protein n=1 Tax=Marchantia polymorpha subsp. ruderalis TaxID=1480154 RepID=A0A176VY75_MARPO|nr:hypothetical protein AXG93_4368s2180 [Marchantia polymorpha subsp. ruderalis]